MKTLSQIMSTFLALGLTFLASYVVYLYSAKATIDEKIQDIGSEIAVLIKSAPVYSDTYNRNLYVFDYHPFMQYRDKSPDSTIVDIHERIAQDLIMAGVFQQQEPMDRLSSFKKQNYDGPILGRIWIHLIKKSIDHLAPKDLWWPGRTPVPVILGPPRPTIQKELFPFGPIGVEQWSDDFQAINNNINYLLYYQKDFLPDLQEYLNKYKDRGYKTAPAIDLNGWVKNITDISTQMDKKNIHIQSLLLLKERYSIPSRLPNKEWILLLGSLTFILGVALPIGILSFKTDTSVPMTVNIVISSVAIICLCGTAVLLIKDVLSGHKNEIFTKYISPFKEQLLEDEKSHHQIVFFNYEIVNELLSEKNANRIPNELLILLKQYRESVTQSNNCSNQIVDKISNALIQSKILSIYFIDSLSADREEMVFNLIDPEKRSTFLKTWFKPLKKITFRADRGGFSSPVVTISLPQDIDEINKIESEIHSIYNIHIESIEFKNCMSTRHIMEDHRKTLLTQMSKLNGENN